jgi:hypothetical protein
VIPVAPERLDLPPAGNGLRDNFDSKPMVYNVRVYIELLLCKEQSIALRFSFRIQSDNIISKTSHLLKPEFNALI